MPRSRGGVGNELFAGIAGTAAQTVAQKVRSWGASESVEPADPWAEAPAPAQVAKRIGHDILGVDTSPRRGMQFGLMVWATLYAQLLPLGINEPPWRYPITELATDLAYHAVYGIGTVSRFHV